MDGDGPQVGEELEPAAEREECLLRPYPRVRVVPLRAADRAEEDGIGSPGRLDVLGPDRDAVGIDPGAAGDDLVPGESRSRMRAPAASRTRRAAPTTSGPTPSPGIAASRYVAPHYGSSSTVRWATYAGEAGPISAPWSLLTAAR